MRVFFIVSVSLIMAGCDAKAQHEARHEVYETVKMCGHSGLELVQHGKDLFIRDPAERDSARHVDQKDVIRFCGD